MSARHDLLVVDGYNVMGASPRYQHLVDEGGDSRDLGTDPFVRARERLVTDVAAFAQGRYDAVVVFDGANNLSDERPTCMCAGVTVEFSRQGESADALIERIVTDARRAGRSVALVTSDNTVRATVGMGVARMSSDLLVHEMEVGDAEVAEEQRRPDDAHDPRGPPEPGAAPQALGASGEMRHPPTGAGGLARKTLSCEGRAGLAQW